MPEIQAPKKDKVTLKEFKMWLDGLMSGNDHPRDLPTLDQWRKILNMMERIEEPAAAAPTNQVQYWYYPNGYIGTLYPTVQPSHTHPHWGSTGGVATITPSGVQSQTLGGTNYLNTWNTGTLAGFNAK